MTNSSSQYTELYNIIGYAFKDESLIREALTHPSLEGTPNYQRLEFIGDRVLGLAIAAWMYELHPNVDEGGLASRHTNLVRREACAKIAADLKLGDFIHMAKSSEDTGGRKRETIIADVCESVIGAICLEAGYLEAEKFIRKFWHEMAHNLKVAKRDAKTRLQELVQSRGINTPVYTTIDKSGPDHQPTFTIAVKVKGDGEEIAKGHSKREAEQQAAEIMLDRLKVEWKK